MIINEKSVRPEVRGTTDFYGGASSPNRSPPRTPSRRSSFFASDGQAETERLFAEQRGHRLRTILTSFEAKGVPYAVGPVQPAHSAPYTNYLRLGWIFTDRPQPMNNVI